jgi:hypothetical protein
MPTICYQLLLNEDDNVYDRNRKVSSSLSVMWVCPWKGETVGGTSPVKEPSLSVMR